MKFSPKWISRISQLPECVLSRSGQAQLSHYTARFREWGEGPPLLLIHGMAGGIELVRPLAERLGHYFHVISFQLRGEDDCFVLRREFGIDDLVQDVIEFLNWRGLERPDVLGVSFGGIIALECAAKHQHRLRSVSIHGVGARFESGLIKSIAGQVLSDYPLPQSNPFVNQFFRLLLGRGPQPLQLVDSIARLCWQTDQSVITRRFRLIRRLNLVPKLNRIRIPVLAMAADRDVLVSQQSLNDLCQNVPDIRFSKLPSGGHLSFVVDPVRVAREVIDFSEALR